MLKNILKLVFLGVVGFGLLVYLTAEKPQKIDNSNLGNVELSLKSFPTKLEIVGTKKVALTNELFKKGSKSLLIVGNHDSLSVIKDLKKYYEINLPYIMVANISNAPWFIKKWAIPGKLEELNTGTKIPMIYDYDGFVIKALKQYDTTKTSYFVYIVDEVGNITKVYTGSVKKGAMDGSMNDTEKKDALKPIISFLK